MANRDLVNLLKQGVTVWNAQRPRGFQTHLDLSGADLTGLDLRGADFASVEVIMGTQYGVRLHRSKLVRVDLSGTILRAMDLVGTNLHMADLSGADLAGANLSGAILTGANLYDANLSGARLIEADLSQAQLVRTNVDGASFSRCFIYGISAWDLRGKPTDQNSLIITPKGEPTVAVDNIEVSQFVYLLLRNEKLRQVIDTVGKKTVLILGRFTPERKAVLEAIREALRERGYVPILFDFDIPEDRDITETVTLLARMARFIIADLTEPSSIPKELEAIVPDLAVPVQSLIQSSHRPYAMFRDYWKYPWVLEPHRYEALEALIAELEPAVIVPAEAKAKELALRRATAMGSA